MINLYLSQVNYCVGHGAYKGYYLPYSVGCLWSYAGRDARIAESYRLAELLYRREPVEEVVARLDTPGVVGFSCYIWNWNYNRALARAIRERFPDALIVFGGPQVPDRAAGFFRDHPYVDLLVHGEGEQPFLDILRARLDGRPYDAIPGLSLRQPDGATLTTPRQARLDLEALDIPSPYVSGLFDPLVAANPGVQWNATMETNRGCPFACTFCDWGSLTFAKVRKVDEARVLAELDWFAANRIDFVYNADANFGAFPERDHAFVRHAIRAKQATGFPRTMAVTWYKNSNERILRIAKEMSDANLGRSVTLSVQSMSPAVIKAIKRTNLGFNSLKHLLGLCARLELPSYTEVILGLPEETYDSWVKGLCEILEMGQHTTIDIWQCGLYENAELNDPAYRAQYGIETRALDNYTWDTGGDRDGIAETTEIVCATRAMPFDDYVRALMYSWLILHFHIGGWTQMAARFLRLEGGMPYEEFYGRLLDFIESPASGLLYQEFLETQAAWRDYLATGTFDYRYGQTRFTGYMFIHKSAWVFHSNRAAVMAALGRFLRGLGSLEGAMLEDLLRFQDHFIGDIARPEPEVACFGWNFHDFITERAALEPGPATYRFAPPEPFRDEEEFLSRLYMRRRQGWGRNLVTALPTLAEAC